MKEILSLYEGVSIDIEGNVNFNFEKDSSNDIINLDSDVSGQFTEEDIRYVYGYKYSQNATKQQKKIFRDYIKSGKRTADVEEFVEKAIIKLDIVQKLDSFGALVSIKPSSYPSIISIIGNYLHSYMNPPFLTFELVKQTYNDVIFDTNIAFKSLIEAGWDTVSAEDEVNFINNKFNILKQEGTLFQIKRFIPSEIRKGFSNFLKFKNERQKQTYENLQGVDVLIYDDFLTSGSTVKEIIKYLKSINPNNTLTVFVLINQKS